MIISGNKTNQLQMQINQLSGIMFSSGRIVPDKNYWHHSLETAFKLGNPAPFAETLSHYSWKSIAADISRLYTQLNSQLVSIPLNAGNIRNISTPNISPEGSGRFPKLFKELCKLWRKGLGNLCKGMYLHGSLATDDWTNYSDCDILIVLKNSSVTNAEKLLKLRKLLLEGFSILKVFDPHQHHGFFIASEMDLNYYPESMLPVACLENGKTIQGANELTFYVRPNKFEAIELCISASNRIISRCNENIYDWSGYKLKGFLSGLMLLPALVLGAKELFIYKRESFSEAKDLFTEDEWSVVEWAGRLRQNWPAESRYLNTYRKLGNIHFANRYVDFALRRLGLDKASDFINTDHNESQLASARSFAKKCLYLANESRKNT